MGGIGSGRRRQDPPTLPLDKLVRWVCDCGAEQAMTVETQRVLRQSAATFYCVHGHARWYQPGRSEEDKLREQLENERRQRQRAEQRVAEQADDARQARELAEKERRRANGYKGHATRMTKRAKAGVCPCCNRTFQQLARHMATQHPTFTPMPLEVIDGGKLANG